MKRKQILQILENREYQYYHSMSDKEVKQVYIQWFDLSHDEVNERPLTRMKAIDELVNDYLGYLKQDTTEQLIELAEEYYKGDDDEWE